jgi:hypothetical protein
MKLAKTLTASTVGRHESVLRSERALVKSLEARAKSSSEPPADEGLVAILNEMLRDPEISSAEKRLLRQLRNDFARLASMQPILSAFGRVLSIMSEFGIQMAPTLLIGILFVALLKFPFSFLVVTSYVLFIVLWWFRYQVMLVIFNRQETYRRYILAIEPEAAGFVPEIRMEVFARARLEFLKSMAAYAGSLLFVLFLVATILRSRDQVVAETASNIFLEIFFAVVGLVLTTYGAARKRESDASAAVASGQSA